MTTSILWPARTSRTGTAEQRDESKWPPVVVLPEGPKEPEEQPEVAPGPQVTGQIFNAASQPFFVGTLLDDRLRLRAPILVDIEIEDQFYIAKCEALEEFGYGQDPMSAVDDLRQTLAELYWTLKEERNRLASGLGQLWGRLVEIIEER